MALGVSKTVAGTPSRAVKVGFWPAMASIGLAVGLYVAVDRCLMPCPATPQKRFGVVQEAVERRRFWQRSAGGQLTQGRALAVGYLGILAWKAWDRGYLETIWRVVGRIGGPGQGRSTAAQPGGISGQTGLYLEVPP